MSMQIRPSFGYVTRQDLRHLALRQAEARAVDFLEQNLTDEKKH